jgi:hypothetical protein
VGTARQRHRQGGGRCGYCCDVRRDHGPLLGLGTFHGAGVELGRLLGLLACGRGNGPPVGPLLLR